MRIDEEIDIFLQGCCAMSDDRELIIRALMERFPWADKKHMISRLRLMTETFSIPELKNYLHGKDVWGQDFKLERLAAKNNGIVIVTGQSDDLIEFDGAISAEGDCFDGGNFHLEYSEGKWRLRYGPGKHNNISALWYDPCAVTDEGERIGWTYMSDVPCEKFILTLGGDPYCEGLLIDIKDLWKE